jgi:hypothetical protein
MRSVDRAGFRRAAIPHAGHIAWSSCTIVLTPRRDVDRTSTRRKNSSARAAAIADVEFQIVSNGISLSDSVRPGGVLQR